jgi:hypothetical protein
LLRVPALFPINTSRRTAVHGKLDFIFRSPRRVVDDRLAVVMTVVMIVFVHPKHFRAELGTDFASDAAIRVYGWYT